MGRCTGPTSRSRHVRKNGGTVVTATANTNQVSTTAKGGSDMKINLTVVAAEGGRTQADVLRAVEAGFAERNIRKGDLDAREASFDLVFVEAVQSLNGIADYDASGNYYAFFDGADASVLG